MPENRTSLARIESREFNAQLAVRPEVVVELLASQGWVPVPESDWRWVLQALNPDPDEATLPLLGRAYEGVGEVLLLRKKTPRPGRLLTIRMWDSGVRLMPSNRTLYLGQISEEILVQRFGLFSYWRAANLEQPVRESLLQALAPLQKKEVGAGLVLLRE